MTPAKQNRPQLGRVAIVTGSTSGIGLTVADKLAEAGAAICLNGFGNPEEIEAIRTKMMNTHEVQVIYSNADMSKSAEIRQLYDRTCAELGTPSIVVNNAGIQHVAPIEQFPEEKWDAILAINLTSSFHTIRHSLPAMRAQNWGRIVNIASAHALTASPFKSAYVAAKHGVLGLTRTVALEVAEQQITCIAICPGYVLTPLVEKQIDDQAKVHGIPRDQVIRDVMLKAQPNKRFATTEQIAALALFLCSEEGSSINGSALSMDGGWTA